jgi:predicted membrane-bound dolichyl-phosphate-mannose-protein mannosyltransferase
VEGWVTPAQTVKEAHGRECKSKSKSYWLLCSPTILLVCVYFLGGVETFFFFYAKQILYCLSHASSTFLLELFFQIGSLCLYRSNL